MQLTASGGYGEPKEVKKKLDIFMQEKKSLKTKLWTAESWEDAQRNCCVLTFFL